MLVLEGSKRWEQKKIAKILEIDILKECFENYTNNNWSMVYAFFIKKTQRICTHD